MHEIDGVSGTIILDDGREFRLEKARLLVQHFASDHEVHGAVLTGGEVGLIGEVSPAELAKANPIPCEQFGA